MDNLEQKIGIKSALELEIEELQKALEERRPTIEQARKNFTIACDMQATNNDFYDMACIARTHICLSDKPNFQRLLLNFLIEVIKRAADSVRMGKKDTTDEFIVGNLRICFKIIGCEQPKWYPNGHSTDKEKVITDTLYVNGNYFSKSYLLHILDKLFNIPNSFNIVRINNIKGGETPFDYRKLEEVDYKFKIDSYTELSDIEKRLKKILESKETVLKSMLEESYSGLTLRQIAEFQDAKYIYPMSDSGIPIRKPRYVDPDTGKVRGVDKDKKPIEDLRRVRKP